VQHSRTKGAHGRKKHCDQHETVEELVSTKDVREPGQLCGKNCLTSVIPMERSFCSANAQSTRCSRPKGAILLLKKKGTSPRPNETTQPTWEKTFKKGCESRKKKKGCITESTKGCFSIRANKGGREGGWGLKNQPRNGRHREKPPKRGWSNKEKEWERRADTSQRQPQQSADPRLGGGTAF